MSRHMTATHALVAVLLTALAASAQDEEYRTWTDATGKFKIEARFEKFEKGAVHLKRKDNGQVVAVPAAKLSKADQELVRKMLSDKKKPAAAPPRPSSSTTTSAEMPKSWEGTWNNRKYNTNGPLKCTVTEIDGKTWEAKFEGKGLGKPFTYRAEITAMEKSGKMLLQGTSQIDGDMYRWTGQVEGDALYGRYRSAKGNNGEFRLKELRKRISSSSRD